MDVICFAVSNKLEERFLGIFKLDSLRDFPFIIPIINKYNQEQTMVVNPA